MTDLNAMTELLQQAPDSVEELLATMTPEIYRNLKQSLELRKWPDGKRLGEPQMENAMQLIILYEHRYLPEELRTGRPLKQGCVDSKAGNPQAVDVLDSSGVRNS